MRKIGSAAIAVALLAGLLPGSAAERSVPFVESAGATDVSTGSYDVRTAKLVAPLTSARRAAGSLAREIPDSHVTWEPWLGTAKLVFSQSGYLTKPSPGTADQVARAWLRSHRDLFALTDDAIENAKVTRNAVLPQTGMHALVLRVTYGEIATINGGSIGVNVMPDGRIVSVWANTGPAGRLDAKPKISAAKALQIVANRLGATITVRSLGQRRTGDRLAIFEAGGLYQNHNVRLGAFPTAKGPVLAWRVFLAKAGEEMITSAVDAKTGQILFVNNGVLHAEGNVFENYPGAEFGGTQRVVSFDGDPAASPKGWLTLPTALGIDVPSFTTLGNNVFAWSDWAWPKLAPGLATLLKPIQFNTLPEYMPLAPTGSFNYTYENAWAQSCDPIVLPLPVNIPVRGNSTENPGFVQDRDPTITNLFYFGNKHHDLMYQLGFTEEMGNYQLDNLGKGGKAADAVRMGAQLGILNNQIDNAFFFPGPDGGEPASFITPDDPTTILNYIVPFTGMFLWRAVPSFQAACGDGSVDAHVVWHELTHGTTTRVAGGPDDSDSLNQLQSGSMGEAWSDWFSMHFLTKLGLENGATFGPGVTGNKETGIRHFKLDQNPLTYADIGFGRNGPEVHDDGEIWSATLWDLQTALIARHGKTVGLERVGHLVFDALTLAGMNNPSFLDQRDGILKGDLARYAGQDIDLIWHVFAKRGMGVSAKTTSAKDTNPTAGFDVPGADNGTLSGVVSDVDGGVLKGVKIVLGLGEGEPSGAAITDDLGRFTLKITPGTYNVTIAAAGYGLQPLGSITITRGGTLNRDVTLLKNLSSLGYGAKVISGLADDQLPGLALIDDHEFTGQLMTVGSPIVVQLGGTKPVLVRAVEIAPKPTGGSVLSAATAFTVELSLDGKTWVFGAKGGVTENKPRVITPNWRRLRALIGGAAAAGGGIQARFVRITVTDTIGGEPIPNPIPPPVGSLRPWTAIIADLQVLGSGSDLVAQAVGGEPPFTEDANITIANAGGGSGGADASVTQVIWQNSCTTPPSPIQGLDAWITELPDGYGDGLHTFTLTNSGGQATDLDVYFWNADCSAEVGRIASPAADEAGPIPAGSKWALIILYAGTTTGFNVSAVTTIERVIPPRILGAIPKVPTRVLAEKLPGTGVRDFGVLGAIVLVFAFAVLVWRRRVT